MKVTKEGEADRMTLRLQIEPEAKELIMKKADGIFTLDMHETLSYTGHGHIEPMVKLGKPKEHTYLFEPVEIEGLTCYENVEHTFCDDCIIMMEKFFNYKSIGICPSCDHHGNCPDEKKFR